MEIRKLTCISCPMGCQITVEMDGNEVVSVTGKIPVREGMCMPAKK